MTAPRPYPPDWCDLETIAYLTSMSRATFAQWVKAGSLPDGVRMGGKRLWNRYAVFAAIDEMAGAGTIGRDGDIMGAARGEAKTGPATAAARSPHGGAR